MQTVEGVVNKLYESKTSNGKPKFDMYIKGLDGKVSGFGNQLSNAKEGDIVRCDYEVNGNWKNVKQLTVIATPVDQADTNTTNNVVQLNALQRQGMQVGAAINQAIAAGNTQIDSIRDMAQELLKLGDELSLYEVDYQKKFQQQAKANLEGME